MGTFWPSFPMKPYCRSKNTRIWTICRSSPDWIPSLWMPPQAITRLVWTMLLSMWYVNMITDKWYEPFAWRLNDRPRPLCTMMSEIQYPKWYLWISKLSILKTESYSEIPSSKSKFRLGNLHYYCIVVLLHLGHKWHYLIIWLLHTGYLILDNCKNFCL